MSIWTAIEQAEYAVLLAEVQKLSDWTPETAEAVHVALIGWCERALAGPMKTKDPGAAALYDLLGRLRSTHGDAALDAARPGTVAAWKAFEELLNERLAKLHDGGEYRKAVLARRHVQSVVDALIGRGSMTFRKLRDRLRVSDSTLSQLLARMEAARIVVRERQQGDGRTVGVRLTEEELRLRNAGLRAEAADASGSPALPHRALDASGWLRSLATG